MRQVGRAPWVEGGKPRSDRGAVVIVVAVFAIAAMLLLAFVIDRGRVYVARAQLQNAVDAAALAAVPLTCESPIANPADIRQVAVDYAAANGVVVIPSDVIVQDGIDDRVTGVSVAAEQSQAQFFGGFAGVPEATIAARGTATLLCRTDFQFIATRWLELGSSPTVDANMFAGQCFSSGPGGTYNALIAVSSAEDFTDCNTIAPVPNGSPPIRITGNGAQTPVYGPAFETEYEVDLDGAPITAPSAFDQSPYETTDLTTTGGPLCKDYTGPFTSLVRCDGNDAAPSTLNVGAGDTVGPNCGSPPCVVNPAAPNGIISRSRITFNENSSWGTAPIIVYSGATAADNTEVILLPDVVPANVFVYAPFGKVKFTGSSSQMLGTIFAREIELTGSGGNAASGFEVRFKGDWRLSQ